MRVLALRSFLFSRDGVTSVQAIADTEADIPEELIAGLVAAGFVVAIPSEVIAEPAGPPKRRRRS